MNNAAPPCIRTYWRQRMLMLLAVVVVALSPRVSCAQSCTFSASNIAYGTFSPISGAPVDATGLINANCTGFSTSFVRLCLSIGTISGSTYAQRYLSGPGGQKLAMNIYSDPSRQTIWGSYYASGAASPVSVDLPITDGNASATVTMYGRIAGGQPGTNAGTFTATYGTGDTLFVYLGYSGAPPDCLSTINPNYRVSFTLSATVVADCNITASPLAFPPAGFLDKAVLASTTIQVTCVNGTPYTVSLDRGSSPDGTVAQRKMMQTAGGDGVVYGLYRDAAYTQIWGDGTSGTVTAGGTGNGNVQSFAAYGQVPPQSSKPVGTYLDTITATVNY